MSLRKTDVDYIEKHCEDRKKCVPTLQKRGKEYFLDFSFEETVKLTDTNVAKQTIVSVDLGLNNSATISVMIADGTIIGRHFVKLPKEYDCLNHAINRIKKAQQSGNRRTPRLWAKAKGIRISRVCAWGTSKLAYDGSGAVTRGKKAELKSYSECRFQNGKVYNCDLSATYNIGARYFIREILESLPAKERLALEAKVPQVARRSTCTLSTLINLNAVLISL